MKKRAIVFAAMLLSLSAHADDKGLSKDFSEMEKLLKPHHGETGKRDAMVAVEDVQGKLEPILKENHAEITASESMLKEVLQVGAMMCDIDASYTSVYFLLDLEKAPKFKKALAHLPQEDRNCISSAIEVLKKP